ncbi:hypothetical protein CRENBAI_013406, partial [Crenichthys baileyi]
LSELGETQWQAEDEGEEDDYMPPIKQQKKTAVEELFEEEDSELLSLQQQKPYVSVAQRVEQVLLYTSLSPIPTKDIYVSKHTPFKHPPSKHVSKHPPLHLRGCFPQLETPYILNGATVTADGGQRARWSRLYGSLTTASLPQGSCGYN